MPPHAAMNGRIAFRNEESSPTSNSRFISKPTARKKTVIRQSLMNSIIVRLCPPCESRLKSPTRKCNSCDKKL